MVRLARDRRKGGAAKFGSLIGRATFKYKKSPARPVSRTVPFVHYTCPDCGGEVDLARTPLESGLLRLDALGAEGFALEFGDPEVHALARAALGPCPHGPDPAWDRAALSPWRVRDSSASSARRRAMRAWPTSSPCGGRAPTARGAGR